MSVSTGKYGKVPYEFTFNRDPETKWIRCEVNLQEFVLLDHDSSGPSWSLDFMDRTLTRAAHLITLSDLVATKGGIEIKCHHLMALGRIRLQGVIHASTLGKFHFISSKNAPPKGGDPKMFVVLPPTKEIARIHALFVGVHSAKDASQFLDALKAYYAQVQSQAPGKSLKGVDFWEYFAIPKQVPLSEMGGAGSADQGTRI